MRIKFINADIITGDVHNFVIKGGELVVDGDRIEYLGNTRQNDLARYHRVIDVGGDILMPGLINAHCHMAMTLLKGLGEERELDAWLNEVIFPLEQHLTAEDVYYGTLLAIMECVRGGTTFVADSYYHNQSVFDAAKLSGIGMAILGADMDTQKPASKVLADIESDYNKYNNRYDNIKYIPGCHSIYTCSQKLLELVADFCAINKSPSYIHLSETLEEVGNCTVEHGGLTPPQYLHKLGYFDNGGLCAHVVHADKDDLQLLAQSGISAVHCPGSNLKLGSGIAPVYSMLSGGLNVALGTDGSASNNALDMFREMYLCSALQKGVMNNSGAISARQAITAATLGGARALRLTERGMLKEGYFADIVRIDTSQPHMQPASQDLPTAIVYSAKSTDVKMTMCSGKILYEDGNYNIGFSPDIIYKQCNDIQRRIFLQAGISI